MPVRALLCGLLAATLSAQCRKPAIPEPGLPLRVEQDVEVTYSDGSRTLGELWLPNVSAPSCGWPLVVWVHGLGLDRRVQRDERSFLAGQGYAVWSYDVRGQGAHAALSPGKTAATFDGGAEHLDLAEQILFVRQRYGATLGARLGVAGHSQGGAHAWAAAALSERSASAPNRPPLLFPRVHAIAAGDLVPEPIEFRVKDSRQFHASFTNLLLSGGLGVTVDYSHLDLMLRGFLAQDPGRTVQDLHLEPGRPVLAQLLQTRVPVLASHSWLDAVVSARPLLEFWNRLPATTPRRLLLHTSGIHAAPWNHAEARLLEETRLRWFDRFLWDVADPVAGEAPILASLAPTDMQRLADPMHLWERRQLDTLPRTSVRLLLPAAGPHGLLPPAVPPPTRIEHRLAANFTPTNYALSAAMRTLDGVLQHAPLSESSFALPALAREQELLGLPRIGLAVMPDAPRFTLSAALYARFPGRSDRWMLASESHTALRAIPHQQQRIEFELSPVGCRLPAGTVLEVVLRNHWLVEAPWQRVLMTAPEFTPGVVLVLHGTASASSWIELPLREVQPAVMTPESAIPASAPRAIPLQLSAGSEMAGARYVLFGGLSGHAPIGFMPPVQLDPLAVELYGLGNTMLTQNFFGMLGAGGRANAEFGAHLLGPLPAPWIGRRLSFGAVVLGGRGLQPTNVVDVVIY